MTVQEPAHAGPEPSPVPDEVLSGQYGEICKSHAGITDFRAKLLSLLPIASGAGLILVGRSLDRGLLTPIGLYGAAVTLGLFWYELRGIQTCKRLREQAALLEDSLEVPAGMGQFRDRPAAALGGWIGAEGASWSVYPAVVLGWVYLAGLGGSWWTVVPAWILAVGYMAIIAAVWFRLAAARRVIGRRVTVASLPATTDRLG
jgi:hypothetical protein